MIWIVERRLRGIRSRHLWAFTNRAEARSAFASRRRELGPGEILDLYRAYAERGLEAQAVGKATS